jgi:YegS/Rv2252/BmrU family lipid kinase
MKTVFIVNPAAGNGNSLAKWEQFKKELAFPYETMLTEYAGHATDLVRSLRSTGEICLIIGFGGDGTLREVIAGAAGAPNIVVGSVPAGSGNDFSRGFYSFRDGAAIGRFMEKPVFSKEDMGELNASDTWHFVSSSGIGFDAEISVWVNRSAAKKALNRIGAGKLVYLVYVLRTLAGFQKFGLSVQQDGTETVYEDVWFATISNQPYFGGGMKISPKSKTDDGLLELTVVHGISRLKLLLVFGTVFSGSHTKFKEVVQMSGRGFRLAADREVDRHVDGDSAGKTAAGEEMYYRISADYWNAVNKGKKEDEQ